MLKIDSSDPDIHICRRYNQIWIFHLCKLDIRARNVAALEDYCLSYLQNRKILKRNDTKYWDRSAAANSEDLNQTLLREQSNQDLYCLSLRSSFKQ